MLQFTVGSVLVIVAIGTIEKDRVMGVEEAGLDQAAEEGQAWKYIKELFKKGHLDGRSRVTAYVLGERIDPEENDVRSEKDGRVKIVPMLYSDLIKRAKQRLLRLHDEVVAAPFMQERFAEADDEEEPLNLGLG